MSFTTSLPNDLKDWENVYPITDPQWDRYWRALAPFFSSHGYMLYCSGMHGGSSIPDPVNKIPGTHHSSFGFYGRCSETFLFQFPVDHADLFAATDRAHRHVVIKVVSKGDYGPDGEELAILERLNSEPLRSDPCNPALPVLEFLKYQDWNFVVMPMATDCHSYVFLNISECLDFAQQLMEGICFLHKNLIAHQDIAHENILMNHFGDVPQRREYAQTEKGFACYIHNPAPPFRSTFPAKYFLIDFGLSVRFSPDTHPSSRFAWPINLGRPQAAPEQRQSASPAPYDPFAADVYQTGYLLHAWFNEIESEVPELLPLLQDMTHHVPCSRPTMVKALERLKVLRSQVPRDLAFKEHVVEYPDFDSAP